MACSRLAARSPAVRPSLNVDLTAKAALPAASSRDFAIWIAPVSPPARSATPHTATDETSSVQSTRATSTLSMSRSRAFRRPPSGMPHCRGGSHRSPRSRRPRGLLEFAWTAWRRSGMPLPNGCGTQFLARVFRIVRCRVGKASFRLRAGHSTRLPEPATLNRSQALVRGRGPPEASTTAIRGTTAVHIPVPSHGHVRRRRNGTAG